MDCCISVEHRVVTFLFIWLSKPAAAAAKLLQSCPTLCDPIDSSPPGSPVAGILQARTLEWVAISFSNAWKWKVKVKSLSRVQLFATPWTAAYQAPPSVGFSRQEYWSGVPLPSPSLLHIKQPNSVPYLQAPHPWWIESADAESGNMEDHCILETGRIFPFSKSIIKYLGSNGGHKLFAILK